MKFAQYSAISHEYSGWTLWDIKRLTPRERTYWCELAKWRYAYQKWIEENEGVEQLGAAWQ